MAATTVLSVVLLMMVGMQDQMSRAWTNANRRTDATREARIGLRMLTEDFIHYYIRDVYTNAGSSRANYNPTTNRIPMAYFSNASTPIGSLSIPNAQPGSQGLFFLSQRRPGKNSPADQLSAVGYYIAWDTNTDINGFTTTNYNLYRYVNTNRLSILTSYMASTNLADLFPNVSTTNTGMNEILARNAINLRIYFYPASNVPSSGLIYRLAEGDTNATTSYSGNRCVFELTTYPENIANSVLQSGANMSAWTNTNNIKRYGRTFEISMDFERALSN
jgi:hypothetical protein